jgi:hypothetical protein
MEGQGSNQNERNDDENERIQERKGENKTKINKVRE